MDRVMGGWVAGWIEGWMDGWMDGWMGRCLEYMKKKNGSKKTKSVIGT